jgi:long-chain acyl-CoA synthetase
LANLADHLFKQAQNRGQKTALIYEGRSYTFADIADRVRATAGGLADVGVGIGTRVGLMLNSQPKFILLQQAVFVLGGVVSPLNIFYKRGDLAHAIFCCDLEILVIGQEFLENLPAIGTRGMESLRLVIALGLDPSRETALVKSAKPVTQSEKAIEAPVSLPGHALALMLNTSATTGKAKGVMLSIDNIRANYDRTPGWLGIDSDSVILSVLPLYNTFGLNQCINALMVTGATMVLMQRFDPVKCLAAIQEYRCTFFPAVPTMLQRMFDHAEAGHFDLSSITRIMTGAAPVPAALLERIYASRKRPPSSRWRISSSMLRERLSAPSRSDGRCRRSKCASPRQTERRRRRVRLAKSACVAPT